MNKAIEHQEMMLRSNIKLIAALHKQIEGHFNTQNSKKIKGSDSEASRFEEEQKNLTKYVESLHNIIEKQNEENKLLLEDLNRFKLLAFDGNSCSSFRDFEFRSKYSLPGYAELRILVTDLVLKNGREYEQVHFKMVNKEGRLGIEIRDVENAPDVVDFQDEMVDDFGKFLIVFFSGADPKSTVILNDGEQNSAILNGDDLLLVCSLFDIAVDKLFQNGSSFLFDIDDDEIRNWRRLCSNFKLPHFDVFGYNTSKLVEYYHVEGYAHLTVELFGVYFKGKWFNNFYFKVAAIDLMDNDKNRISDMLRIEFREQEHQINPLQIWPPVEQDEYGYKLSVDIPLESEQFSLETEDFLSSDDRMFIKCLASRVVDIFEAESSTILDIPDKNLWLESFVKLSRLARSR